MNEEQELQQELFQEFSQPSRLKRKQLGIGAVRKVHSVTFSNEQLIFAVIGFIILLVVCFSLGVERGKRISINRIPAQESNIRFEETAEEPLSSGKDLSVYAIQVAAYKDAKQAEREKRALEKDGYEIEIAKSGIYSIIYVSGFASREDAEAVYK